MSWIYNFYSDSDIFHILKESYTVLVFEHECIDGDDDAETRALMGESDIFKINGDDDDRDNSDKIKFGCNVVENFRKRDFCLWWQNFNVVPVISFRQLLSETCYKLAHVRILRCLLTYYTTRGSTYITADRTGLLTDLYRPAIQWLPNIKEHSTDDGETSKSSSM